MRFACQSCGKAYNLPEEKIADKSNVKLKCRVCGAIVEVKRQGEVVAQMLAEVDGKRVRVSEAPAPLLALSSDDDGDDATHAIALSDQILSESGSGEEAAAALLGQVTSALGQQRGIVPLPPPPATGFGPTPIPPPLAQLDPPASPLPPAMPALSRPEGVTSFSREAPIVPPLPNVAGLPTGNAGSPPPPPLPSMGHAEPPSLNGSSGLAPRFGDALPFSDEPMGGVPSPLGMSNATLESAGDTGAFAAMPSVEVVQGGSTPDDMTRKMLAALATGILIGFIIARLFF